MNEARTSPGNESKKGYNSFTGETVYKDKTRLPKSAYVNFFILHGEHVVKLTKSYSLFLNDHKWYKFNHLWDEYRVKMVMCQFGGGKKKKDNLAKKNEI